MAVTPVGSYLRDALEQAGSHAKTPIANSNQSTGVMERFSTRRVGETLLEPRLFVGPNRRVVGGSQ
jgi:hypothetical protein